MVYVCPNTKCPNDETLQANQKCPLCGTMAQNLDANALGDLYVARAEKQEEARGPDRIKPEDIINEPDSAYNFSMVGGALGIGISLILLAYGLNLYQTYSVYYNYYNYYNLDPNSSFYWVFIILGACCLCSALLIIYSAHQLKANPIDHSELGERIIILSIVGLGTIFGLVGGILAVSFKPETRTTQTRKITKICLNCGTVINQGIKFCPECGKEVPFSDKT